MKIKIKNHRLWLFDNQKRLITVCNTFDELEVRMLEEINKNWAKKKETENKEAE